MYTGDRGDRVTNSLAQYTRSKRLSQIDLLQFSALMHAEYSIRELGLIFKPGFCGETTTDGSRRSSITALLIM